MPTEIQNPVATRALVEEFGIKGRFRMMLDEQLAPVVIVGDVRPTLVGGATYQRALFVPAEAAEFAVLTVPGGLASSRASTMILHTLRVWSDEPAFLNILADNTTALTINNQLDLVGVNRLDARRPTSLQGAAGTVAAAPTGTFFADIVDLPADTDVLIDLNGWELPPGPAAAGEFTRLIFQNSVANVGTTFVLTWSLRAQGE